MEKKTITPVDVIKKIIIALVVIVDAYPFGCSHVHLKNHLSL